MSQGSLRQTLDNPEPIAAFPLPLAIEPGASEVCYGLTASNSFVVAWEDACVEREATNRIDAAFELFANGDLTVRYGDTVTNIVARPPEGFVGQGQDDAWALAALPDAYDTITNKGYAAWLMEDYVGVNEPNGHYKVDITIDALPENGPYYLVCGPHRIVVEQPGTYSFPLEVFEEYRAYTCPTRVPLSISYDDGYDIGEAEPLAERRVPRMAARPAPDYYLVCMTPNVYVVPSHVPLAEAVGTRLNLHCNCPSGTWSYSSNFANHLKLVFGFPSSAEIRTAEVADRVVVLMRVAGHECAGVFYIDPPPTPEDETPRHACCNACCGDSCRCDGTCCICNCRCHSNAGGDTGGATGGNGSPGQ